MQASASVNRQARQDADDDMPLPPPARPISKPPLPPTMFAPSQAGTRAQQDHDDTPGFEAPDEDTIRYTGLSQLHTCSLL